MRSKAKAPREVELPISIVLQYAANQDFYVTGRWFTKNDIVNEYYVQLKDFQQRGTKATGPRASVTDLPKVGGTNELDIEKLDALLDLMVERRYLKRRKNTNWWDSFEITDKGRGSRAKPILDGRTSKRPPKIVVITVRPDEHRAILKRVNPIDDLTLANRTYTVGSISNRWGADHSLAVLRTAEQGPNSAHDATRDAIDDLDPDLIVLAGIAGGVASSDFTLGDVIVASRLHDFSVGAVVEGKGAEFTNQGGPMTPKISDLIALVPKLELDFIDWSSDARVMRARPSVDLANKKNFYGPKEVRKRTLDSLTRHFVRDKRIRPLAYPGATASSGSLIKDTSIIRTWRSTARDVTAVEMELSGVYAAARRKNYQYSVLAIRGISDIVGFKRDDDWTGYACETAASFCVALLSNLPRDFFR